MHQNQSQSIYFSKHSKGACPTPPSTLAPCQWKTLQFSPPKLKILYEPLYIFQYNYVCIHVRVCTCMYICLYVTSFIQFTPGTNSSLVLTIHHPDSNVRLDAVKHLIKLLHGTEAMDKECGDSTHIINDKEFVSSALLARLTDDSPKVVMATLEAGPEVDF